MDRRRGERDDSILETPWYVAQIFHLKSFKFHISFLRVGIKAFLTEFLIVRQFPITRLLYGFGISLVCVFALNFLLRLKKLQSAKSCGRSDPRPTCTSSGSSSSKCTYHIYLRVKPGTSMTFAHPLAFKRDRNFHTTTPSMMPLISFINHETFSS